DKGISKLGNASEFYEELEPELMAQHIIASSAGDVRGLVDEILTREHPRLWINMPAQLRERVHERVQEQLPEVVLDFDYTVLLPRRACSMQWKTNWVARISVR
ncbi:MAG: hypothetical protein ACK4N6_01035, partial [Rhodocyclaceae bacterium]